jgi:hypothetical protein
MGAWQAPYYFKAYWYAVGFNIVNSEAIDMLKVWTVNTYIKGRMVLGAVQFTDMHAASDYLQSLLDAGSVSFLHFHFVDGSTV